MNFNRVLETNEGVDPELLADFKRWLKNLGFSLNTDTICHKLVTELLDKRNETRDIVPLVDMTIRAFCQRYQEDKVIDAHGDFIHTARNGADPLAMLHYLGGQIRGSGNSEEWKKSHDRYGGKKRPFDKKLAAEFDDDNFDDYAE